MGVRVVFILAVFNEKYCVSTESDDICMCLPTFSRNVNKGKADDIPCGITFVREMRPEKRAEEGDTVIANG